MQNISFGLEKDRYSIGKLLGSGSYGVVARAYDNIQSRIVAMKRIPNIYEQEDCTRKILREIKMLHMLRDENVVSLLDVELSGTSVYIVTEFCETDLHKLIYSNIRSTMSWGSLEFLKIIYQTLHVLDFIHRSGVLHRDIKPANILLDSNLNVKLCDFGFARCVEHCDSCLEEQADDLTEYVVSRWYRAPEVVLTPGRYGKAQDVWAAGCTIAEVIRLSPLFQGTSVINQLQVIIDVVGKPSTDELNFDMSNKARKYVKNMRSAGTGLSEALTGAASYHQDLLSLLEEMLHFNPLLRITPENSLLLPIFDHMSCPSSVHKKIYLPYTKKEIQMNANMNTEVPVDERVMHKEVMYIVHEIRDALNAVENTSSKDQPRKSSSPFIEGPIQISGANRRSSIQKSKNNVFNDIRKNSVESISSNGNSNCNNPAKGTLTHTNSINVPSLHHKIKPALTGRSHTAQDVPANNMVDNESRGGGGGRDRPGSPLRRALSSIPKQTRQRSDKKILDNLNDKTPNVLRPMLTAFRARLSKPVKWAFLGRKVEPETTSQVTPSTLDVESVGTISRPLNRKNSGVGDKHKSGKPMVATSSGDVGVLMLSTEYDGGQFSMLGQNGKQGSFSKGGRSTSGSGDAKGDRHNNVELNTPVKPMRSSLINQSNPYRGSDSYQ
eukprot:gene11525-24113_t